MRAVRIVELGRPLQLCDVPRPDPGAGQIRLRVEAAGICHSDVHYRDGTASLARLPTTPGHEIAGRVDAVGPGVDGMGPGDRVALHYLVCCGRCDQCARGREQFCRTGQMLGKHLDGGYAEFVVAPARNAVPIAGGVSSEEAAIMMCSSATALHAIRQARLVPGDRVAIFGAGGLGLSAVQLARASGAAEVFAVDIDAGKLDAAARYGAIPVNAADGPPERRIRDATSGEGVDVALELAGRPETQRQAVACLAVKGRAALAGISHEPFRLNAFADVIGREAEVIGVSDHLYAELTDLMEMVRDGRLDLRTIVADRVPLDAREINDRLDALAGSRGRTRSVIIP